MNIEMKLDVSKDVAKRGAFSHERAESVFSLVETGCDKRTGAH